MNEGFQIKVLGAGLGLNKQEEAGQGPAFHATALNVLSCLLFTG